MVNGQGNKMAQIVAYYADNVIYEEGPFVLTHWACDWRIEVELVGHNCPVLIDASISNMLVNHGFPLIGKAPNAYKERLEKVVDWLNNQVKLGRIVNINGQWVAA